MSEEGGDPPPVSFDQLWRKQAWLPIANCPGRYRLASRNSVLTPGELANCELEVEVHEPPACRDLVVVAEIRDGGLISYHRSDDTYVHTLNTVDGFARKLKALGLR